MLRIAILISLLVAVSVSAAAPSGRTIDRAALVGTWRLLSISDKNDRLLPIPRQADVTLTFRRDDRCAFAVTMKSGTTNRETAFECRYTLDGSRFTLEITKPAVKPRKPPEEMRVRLTASGQLIIVSLKSKQAVTLKRIR